MENRREFLKKMAAIAGATAMGNGFAEAIERAYAIHPAPGSTFLDAEHVVILMQENRSFDHAFGTLKGVRGFSDRRYIKQPDGTPVWFQRDKKGLAYPPFRLNLKESKATWLGAVPHSRESQVDAYNEGKLDQWIEAKKRRKDDDFPFAMGYYNREDIPFYYNLADAFTICDQNFCSGMTSTWPNRLFFWTGAIRADKKAGSKAWIRNELKRGEANWKTFPERLEEAGVPWRIYQNEVSHGGRFKGEERSWLSSFSCNPMEFFEQYHIQFSPRYWDSLTSRQQTLKEEIQALEAELREASSESEAYEKGYRSLEKKRSVLKETEAELEKWNPERFGDLSPHQQQLHQKAFSTNKDDPDYLHVEELGYTDTSGKKKSMVVPKGDVLHQFRKDVRQNQLPAVSWIIPAQNYSDHPSAPWYGAWYISEIMNILTENPETWKKTIFLMTYDENDGYFDHVAPFVPPHTEDPESGKCSAGLDSEEEHISLNQELDEGRPGKQARGGPIGLGYRVPMIVASPWSRGGKVCSEVFDHTSTLRFLEKWVKHRYKRDVREDNISNWRRAICGDLSSAFSSFDPNTSGEQLSFVDRDPFFVRIREAQHCTLTLPWRGFNGSEMNALVNNPWATPDMPRQEPGTKIAQPLFYDLTGNLSIRNGKPLLSLSSSNAIFGDKSLGAPFILHGAGKARHYAVSSGNRLEDSLSSSSLAYHLELYGPNGFFRRFKGNLQDDLLELSCQNYLDKNQKPALKLSFKNSGRRALNITIDDQLYHAKTEQINLQGASQQSVLLSQEKSGGWYEVSIRVNELINFEHVFAGKIENGLPGTTDPASIA